MLTKTALISTFCVSVVVLCIPYLQMSYTQLALPNALIGFGLVAPISGAILTRVLTPASFREVWLWVLGVFPAVVIIRIFYDLASGNGDHNLWPFELIIAVILGACVGAAGSGIGSAIRSLRAGPGSSS